jgi:CBS domain containing-hemolysin-like protein
VLTTIAELAAVLLIVGANAFFVAAEYALVTVRRTRLEQLISEGSRRAARVKALIEQPTNFISTIQLGVTLSSLALGAVGEPVVASIFESPLNYLPDRFQHGFALTMSVILAFTVLSYFHVVLGEIVPKAIGLQRAESVAMWVSGPIRFFFTVFRPFVWVLVTSSGAVLRTFKLPQPTGVSMVHSEEELKMLVTASRREGVLEEDEQTMLHRVFEFADKDAADVMVPRPDVVALPMDISTDDALRTVLDRPYTRYPVYEGELDNVVGVLHVRDLVTAMQRNAQGEFELRSILRPAIVVPETKPLDELLADFRRTSNHLAIVVDEYGSVAGIVTLEDLIEEIVGEIGDEFDLPDRAIRRLGRGRIRVEGSFPIDEFNDRFGKDLPREDYHTIGGFMFGELGRAPRVGDIVGYDGVRFEVRATDGPRIREVDITFSGAERSPAPEAATG